MTARPITVDLFAGGGGFTHGAEQGGARVILAVNHDEHAIEMHRRNHPHVRHLCESVWDVKPREAVGYRPVDLLLASPDCRHFSRAKGGATRNKGIRGLAWVVRDWARDVRPRVILLENVAEFVTWGPLDEHGKIIPELKGDTFQRFVRELEDFGYHVEWRVLNAAEFGTPTSRRRLFLIARRDGLPICWPEPTHGPDRTPYRTAAECIDWSISCPSIFTRKRPLAEATQRRIAAGVRKYVLEAARPFLVCLTHGGRVEDLDEPCRTITAAHRGERAVVVPSLVQLGYGERKGQAPRVLDLNAPLGTVVAGGRKHGLVAAFLAKHYGGNSTPGANLCDPMSTVTARDHHALVAGHLVKFYGTSTVASLADPMPTVTAGGGRGGGHAALVAAFLLKYYSRATGQPLDEPLHTVVSKARFGLVTLPIDGQEYALVDIGMRMLEPRELAAANGAADMILTGTKSQQTARIGNMVCPPVARALVAANFPDGVPEQLAMFSEAA